MFELTTNMIFLYYPSVDAVTTATFPSNRLHFIEEDALVPKVRTLWFIVVRNIFLIKSVKHNVLRDVARYYYKSWQILAYAITW